jgi:hypothetical protein
MDIDGNKESDSWFDDVARLDHEVGHVKNSVLEGSPLDTEDVLRVLAHEVVLLGGGVLSFFLSDGPALGLELVLEDVVHLHEPDGLAAGDESLVGSFSDLHSLQVSLSAVSDIDDAHLGVRHRVALAKEQGLEDLARGEVSAGLGRAKNKRWVDSHDLDLARVVQLLLEIPGSLLGKGLGSGVRLKTAWSIRVGPVGLVEGVIGWPILRVTGIDRGNTRGDDDSLSSGTDSTLHGGKRAVDGWLGERVSVVLTDAHNEGRGSVDDVGGSSKGINHGLLVKEVSLNKLKLVVKGTETLLKWLHLLGVVFVSDGSTYSEASILKENFNG